MGLGARPVKAKVEARPAVAGKSRKARGATGLQFKQRLAEALEQHAAVNEILQIISASPSNVQPVLNAVAERAARLCQAPLARVLLVDGDVLRAMAEYSLDGTSQARTAPLPLKRSTITGRAVLDRATIHHGDVVPLLDTEYPDALNARRLGLRAVLAVPLMREGNAYGVILLWRREPRLFSPDQVALVQTFAQQAAIAVDNVRLFKDLASRNHDVTEALEQQTATGEILQVISRSPADVQPAFDIIAERAGKLCDAELAVVSRFDGEVIELAAIHGLVSEAVTMVRTLFPMRLDAPTVTARVIRSAAIVHIADVLAEQNYGLKDFARVAGYRGAVGVPLLRDGKPIGCIAVMRPEQGLFPDSQTALLQTFADQAVIAIENVRLFTETKEALERQTATSDILRVISQSPRDVRPVFDAIAAAALKLCDASSAAVLTFDGELMRLGALANVSADETDAVRLRYPKPPGRETAGSRAILTGSTVVVPDVLEDPEFEVRARSFRSVVSAPLMRDGSPIGAITVGRPEPGRFPDQQIALLQTFADQAVIAIENVRLFNETKEALEQQAAISEILQVFSNSPGDVKPMLNAVSQAAQ